MLSDLMQLRPSAPSETEGDKSDRETKTTEDSKAPMYSTSRTNSGSDIVKIFAGKLYDPYALQLVPKQLITLSSRTGLILKVRTYGDRDELVFDPLLAPSRTDDGEIIDLRECTVMPGFVDAHVHRE